MIPWLGSLTKLVEQFINQASTTDIRPFYCNSVRDTRVGRGLGPEGNWVSSGEGGEGGPGPPNKEGDKQSIPSEEGGKMKQEEEGSTSQA